MPLRTFPKITTARRSTQRQERPARAMTIVRPDREVLSRQCLPYFVGVSAASAGASRISMNLVVIPPHGSAEPHFHRGFESVKSISSTVPV